MSALTRRSNLVTGTLFAAAAGLFVRVLAFLYRPIVLGMFRPFDGQDGWLGLGMAQAPATAYLIALSFTSTGFNVAIAKLVSERVALGDRAGAERIFRTSLWLMLGLGLLAGLLFFLGAPGLESAAKMTGTAYGYMAMAPAVLVMSVAAAYRGLFQGLQRLQVSNLSLLLEAVVRILAGLTLVHILAPHSLPLAAAGYNLGDFAGALATLLYLLAIYLRSRTALWGLPETRPRSLPAARTGILTTLRAICRIGVPVALLGAAPPLMSYLDTFLLGRSLPGATSAMVYGQLSSGVAIVWVPAVFTGALCTSLVPAMADALARKQQETAGRYASLAYRAAALIAWPAMLGLVVLAVPIYKFIFHSTAGASLLTVLGLSTLPIMIQQTAAGVLQGMGRNRAPAVTVLAGACLKVVLTLLLVPRWGPAGAAWATVFGFTASAILSVAALRRMPAFDPDWVGTALKPGLAAVAMGASTGAVWWFWASRVTTPWLESLCTLLLVGLGVILYGIALVLLRGISRDDMQRLPLPDRLRAHLFR